MTGQTDEEFIPVLKGHTPEDSDWDDAVKADADGKAEITGLTPGREYDVYARKAESDTCKAGPASDPAAVTMPKAGQQAPDAPSDAALMYTD